MAHLKPAHDLVLALLIAAVSIYLATTGSRRLALFLRRFTVLDGNEDVLLGRAFSFVVLWLGGSLLLSLTGIPNLPFISFGTVGLVLGLGMQGIIDAFFKGAYLLIAKEVRIGDYVTVAAPEGPVSGLVERQSFRATWFRTPLGDLVPVPNEVLWSSTYVILGKDSIAKLPMLQEEHL